MNDELDMANGLSAGEVSDQVLLNRYSRSHAPEPFLQLMQRHMRMVYGTCLRITANVHDAEDLSQECFFDLARQSGEVRTSLVGWLHQAATHRALNRLRGEKRRRVHEQVAGLDQIQETSAATGTNSEISWNEISPIFDQILSELPEQHRAPIVMHYLEGATQAEVANSLGVHQSTVSRRLTEGIERLRDGFRRLGVVVPVAAMLSWLTTQSAIAAPPTLASSISKIGLAGVGTTMAATSTGSGFVSSFLAAVKASFVLLFAPLIAGILWGEIVFLVVLALWCSYLALRRPEWFRVLCFTRQFPNIYEWPFYPLTRWTWQTPPREWQLWVAFYFVTGIELLGLAILPLPRRIWAMPFAGSLLQLDEFRSWHFAIQFLLMPFAGSLIPLAWAGFNMFTGARILRRVKSCRAEASESSVASDSPVDGALLLTYALAGIVLVAKLISSPWFFSQPENGSGKFLLNIVCATAWATTLIWGSLLVLDRYRRWRTQGMISATDSKRIDDLAPPRWLLTVLMVIPLAVSLLITLATLIQDVYPVYVPFGDTSDAVARRRIFMMTLAAMDFVVMGISPLAYLYRRIPRIAWGVAFSTIGLIGTLHLGLFTKTIIAAPVLEAPARFEPPPRMELLDGHFILENAPNLLANDSLNSNVKYLGLRSLLSVRSRSAPTITVEYGEHQARLEVPSNSDHIEFETNVAMLVVGSNFQKGIPTQIQVSLIVVDGNSRLQKLEQFMLPIPAEISPDDWNDQFEAIEQEHEKAYLLGETVALGIVQEKPVTLKVNEK